MSSTYNHLTITPKTHGVTCAGRLVLVGSEGNYIEAIEFTNPSLSIPIPKESEALAQSYKIQVRTGGKWRIHGTSHLVSKPAPPVDQASIRLQPLHPPAFGQLGSTAQTSHQPPGQAQQETAHARSRKNRLHARRDAIVATIDSLDQDLPSQGPAPLATPATIERTSALLFPVYANRNDGLGERLNAIFNALLVSEITGAPFQFAWPDANSPRFASFHAVTPVERVFAPDFLHDALVSTEVTDGAKALEMPRGPLTEIRAILLDSLHESSCICPQSPGLISILEEPETTRRQLVENVLSRIRLTPTLENVRTTTLQRIDLPEDAVAIHIRAGDIVYGRYASNPRWIGKVICAPMAAILAQEIHHRGGKAILFGQESRSAKLISERTGCHTADEFYHDEFNDSLKQAFADIFLMSRCSGIYSGTSGFSRIASQIGLNPRLSPFSLFSRAEWAQLLHDEVSTNPETYTPEQRAYTYLVCFTLALETGDNAPLQMYIEQARKHAPKNLMYTLIEALTPLHVGAPEKAEELLTNYFKQIPFHPRFLFKRSDHIRTLTAKDKAPNLAFSRFIPNGFECKENLPHLSSTVRFLTSPFRQESVDTLHNDLASIRSRKL